jgi:predicted aspartyl protease
MLRLVIVAGVCLLLAGCVSAPQRLNLASFDPQVIAQEPQARMTLIPEGNRQWRVRAMVNGQQGIFAVDTGSDATILSPQFAKKIGALDTAIPGQFSGPNQIGQKLRFTKLIYLQLGGILYLGFYAPILDLDHINRAMRNPIDGILGNNVLRKTACTFDWPNSSLVLDTSSLPRPTNAIPITMRDNRVFLIADVNNQKTELALDTGAYCSSLTQNEVRRLNIPESRRNKITGRRIDISESRQTVQTQITLDTFKLAKIDRANFPVLIWDNSVLGMDVLETCILTYDARAGWMALR